MMTDAMTHTLSQTWDHLFTVTLATLEPPAAVALLFHTPDLVAAMARVEQMALTGDVAATQRACQDLARACKTAVAGRQP